MSIIINSLGKTEFTLFYSATGFGEGKIVTGYLIYPDFTKSPLTTFNEIGDGIYGASFPYMRKTLEYEEKYGIVVKEDEATKLFTTIKMINCGNTMSLETRSMDS